MERLVDDVAENLGAPGDLTVDRLRIGVEQQLGLVVAIALIGGPATANAVAVAGAQARVVAEDRPQATADVAHRVTRLVLAVEETQPDPLGVACVDAKCDAAALECDAGLGGMSEDSWRGSHANKDKSG